MENQFIALIVDVEEISIEEVESRFEHGGAAMCCIFNYYF